MDYYFSDLTHFLAGWVGFGAGLWVGPNKSNKKLKKEKFFRHVLPVKMPRSRVRALARASYRALARDSMPLPGF
jgi:hypothetical protein